MAIGSLVAVGAVPTAAFPVGAVLAWRYNVPESLRAGTQHFAVGSVVAAIAVDLIPLLQGHSEVAVTVGIALGAAVSLALGRTNEADERRPSRALHLALLVTTGIDVLFDGLLLGVGSTHSHIGLTLALALGLENLPLGLAVAAHLRYRHPPGRWKLAVAGGLTAVLPAGLLFGAEVGGHLQGVLFTGLVAFGAAALLFLATEQLIVEAHTMKHSTWSNLALFFGFWLIILLDALV